MDLVAALASPVNADQADFFGRDPSFISPAGADAVLPSEEFAGVGINPAAAIGVCKQHSEPG